MRLAPGSANGPAATSASHPAATNHATQPRTMPHCPARLSHPRNMLLLRPGSGQCPALVGNQVRLVHLEPGHVGRQVQPPRPGAQPSTQHDHLHTPAVASSSSAGCSILTRAERATPHASAQAGTALPLLATQAQAFTLAWRPWRTCGPLPAACWTKLMMRSSRYRALMATSFTMRLPAIASSPLCWTVFSVNCQMQQHGSSRRCVRKAGSSSTSGQPGQRRRSLTHTCAHSRACSGVQPGTGACSRCCCCCCAHLSHDVAHSLLHLMLPSCQHHCQLILEDGALLAALVGAQACERAPPATACCRACAGAAAQLAGCTNMHALATGAASPS